MICTKEDLISIFFCTFFFLDAPENTFDCVEVEAFLKRSPSFGRSVSYSQIFVVFQVCVQYTPFHLFLFWHSTAHTAADLMYGHLLNYSYVEETLRVFKKHVGVVLRDVV